MLRLLPRAIAALTIASFVVACGGTPPPKPKPVVKAKPKVEMVDGIPKPAVTAFNKGLAALEKKPQDYKSAVTGFQEATKHHPKYTVAWLNLAWSYQRLGRHADAAKAYRELEKQQVTDRGVKLALGRALLLSGEADLAIVEFESVIQSHPEDLQARNNLAAAYIAKRDLKTALRYVKEVLAVQPKNVPAIVNLGLLYLKDKKLPLAQLMFQKALDYEKDDKKPQPNKARAHNNLGLTFFAMNIIPGAVQQFIKALDKDPTMDEARLNLGSIYLDYLDYPAALKQFKAVRERFPKNYQATVGEADALYGTGDHEKAAKVYEESLELDQNNSEALLRVGKIYEEQLGKPKVALGFYIKFRDVAKPPKEHSIHETIMFLEQADSMKTQTAGGDPEPEGQKPPEGEKAPEGEQAPEGEKAPEGETAPEGEKAPEGDAAKAAEGAGDPAAAEGEKAAEEKPAEGEKAAEEKPAEGEKKADEKPAEGDKKPADGDAEGEKKVDGET